MGWADLVYRDLCLFFESAKKKNDFLGTWDEGWGTGCCGIALGSIEERHAVTCDAGIGVYSS